MNDEVSRVASLGWDTPEPGPDGVRYISPIVQPDISYSEDGFEVLGLDGGSGFWFDHRAAAVRRELEQLGITAMWEVGAGTGAMAHRLQSASTEVVTVEPLAVGARASADLGLASLCGTLQDLHLPDQSIPSIGVFDVLEHLEDTKSVVEEMHRVLEPGGLVIATVPAFQWLWGDEDDVAGHHRRYTKSTLTAEFSSFGFTRMRTEYLYASLVPPAALLRALPYRLGRRASREAVFQAMRNQLRIRPAADRFARAVLSAESRVARFVPLPFGLSVLGVFRKR